MDPSTFVDIPAFLSAVGVIVSIADDKPDS
jgi:hypothetical protein